MPRLWDDNSLRQEPWWNADRRARFAKREPHRKVRRIRISVCRRSASFIYWFGEWGVANSEIEKPPLFSVSHPVIRASAFALRASADGSRGWNLQNSGAGASRER